MALLWLEVALDEEGKMTEVRVVAADSMGSIQSKLPAELLNKAGRGRDETPGPPTFNVFLFILSSLGLLLLFFKWICYDVGFTELL